MANMRQNGNSMQKGQIQSEKQANLNQNGVFKANSESKAKQQIGKLKQNFESKA